MNKKGLGFDAASILQRFDRSSPDALLQSIAQELFRVDQANALLKARLSAMESLLTISDRIAASEEPEFAAPYPDRITIDAADSFLGSLGFYELEYENDGLPYRWSGPERQFSFQLFVDRREPLHLNFQFGQFYATVPVEGLQCYVDGEKITLMVGGAEGRHEAKGALPARKDRGGTVLTFVCPEMGSPELRGHSDRRQLGLTFYQLTVGTENSAAATARPAFSFKETSPIFVSSGSDRGDFTTASSIPPPSPFESEPSARISSTQGTARQKRLAGAVANGLDARAEASETEPNKPVSQNIVFSEGQVLAKKEG